MRIYIHTTPNVETIPFNYQQKMVGTIHKWIGKDNDLHGHLSLYSFSWLMNGKINKDGFDFLGGANFFISFYDEEIIKRIITSIRNNPVMFCGLNVTDITIEESPCLSTRSLFYVASPILIKRYLGDDRNLRYYSFYDKNANILMKETFINKMNLAGVPKDETFNIQFDLDYIKKRTKLVNYDDIKIKANMCPVIIEGTEVTKNFAWNVGIGNSTGIGFGAIY